MDTKYESIMQEVDKLEDDQEYAQAEETLRNLFSDFTANSVLLSMEDYPDEYFQNVKLVALRGAELSFRINNKLLLEDYLLTACRIAAIFPSYDKTYARNKLAELEELGVSSPLIHFLRGDIEYNSDNPTEAEEHFQNALSETSDTAKWITKSFIMQMLGMCAVDEEDEQKARKMFLDAMAEDPKNEFAKIEFGRSLCLFGDYSGAVDLLSGVSTGADTKVPFFRGLANYRLGNLETAIEDLAEARERATGIYESESQAINEVLAEALNSLAVELMDKGDDAKAKETLEWSIKICPSDKAQKNLSILQKQSIEVRGCLKDSEEKYLAGDLEGASLALEQALANDADLEDRVHILTMLGMLYIEQGSSNDGDQPGSQSAKDINLVSLGLEKTEKALSEDASQQLNYFSNTKNLELLESADRAYATRVAAQQQQNADKALEYAHRATSLFNIIRPNPMVLTLFFLGLLYQQCGYNDYARTCLRQVVESESIHLYGEQGDKIRQDARNCLESI